MSEEYFDKINDYWDEITGMYVAFEDKKPIIEFEPNRIRIIAYPAEEYLLSPIAVPLSVSFMLRL